MATATVLGTGALGTVIVRALRDSGVDTTVWNRTPGNARRAIALGARFEENAGDALGASDIVIVCLPTHDVTRSVLATADSALVGRNIVNMTSGTPDDARATSTWLHGANAAYIDAAAMSGTEPVGTEDALFLYSGPRASFEQVEPMLAILGRTAFVGEEPGAASLLDTALLGMNLGLLIGFYQAVALGAAAGVDPPSLAAIAEGYLPFAAGLLREHADQSVLREYPPNEGAVNVLAAAAEHLRSTSERLGISTEFPEAATSLLQRGTANGYGEEGIASLIDVIRGERRS